MSNPRKQQSGSQIISVYEILVWIIYVCLYKYSELAGDSWLPRLRTNFPFPILIPFAIATTAYVIPFYRLIGPWLLKKRQYTALFFTTIAWFVFIPKWVNWFMAALFRFLNHNPVMTVFWEKQFAWFDHALMTRGMQVTIILTDMLAFFSVMFMRYAFSAEKQRHVLEKDNLVLQLETLKAQLHPHFLFNTLNSIYGMSITGAKETPAFILRLSDMMRYILYDCQQNQVPVEKDLDFLDNYLEMEKKRYPMANIHFQIDRNSLQDLSIAPLLFIPFVENSFKHGAHRISDNGFVKGAITVTQNRVHFMISNSKVLITPMQSSYYGGVGLENAKKRLALYYPERHTLDITTDNHTYTVHLHIQC
ncbi:sensor histidine kinase [Chitinophaga pendula]|uniref:sensor histidine kinase n=1 Tax=Chitinophaga TaxID=79328 RepID=UPI000BAECE04|nr:MULTISPECIES: sensor histidine kinase [Chitinophaga]ASZ10996.1 hypothetical protein CK934_08485 [Chitinophaga sp. MD30]UCJ06013.1 sensor histidine kinase [Chitinophaga pendula]